MERMSTEAFSERLMPPSQGVLVHVCVFLEVDVGCCTMAPCWPKPVVLLRVLSAPVLINSSWFSFYSGADLCLAKVSQAQHF